MRLLGEVIPSPFLRDSEIDKSPFLIVFRLVFCVASRVTYPDMRPLMLLEYEPKSCAIYGNLFARGRILPGYRISSPVTKGLCGDL